MTCESFAILAKPHWLRLRLRLIHIILNILSNYNYFILNGFDQLWYAYLSILRKALYIMDKKKILQMLATLAGIVVIAVSISKLVGGNSQTLTEYAQENGLAPDIELNSGEADYSQPTEVPTAEPTSAPTEAPTAEPSSVPTEAPSQLVGASLNGTSQTDKRVVHEDGFYYEPLSDNLRRYMTGVSYPASEGENAVTSPAITFEELRYVHIYHYNFEGIAVEGELVCNEYIAQDLVEIFYELYRNEYQIEKVQLIDLYDGDDDASMTDNNTSCFNYRVVGGTDSRVRLFLSLQACVGVGNRYQSAVQPLHYLQQRRHRECCSRSRLRLCRPFCRLPL